MKLHYCLHKKAFDPQNEAFESHTRVGFNQSSSNRSDRVEHNLTFILCLV